MFCVGLLSPTFGQVSDTFSVTTSNWGTPTLTPVGPPPVGSSGVSFTQDNDFSRMDWQVTLGGPSNSDNLFMPLQSHGGTYDMDWNLTLDVVNSFSAGTDQSVQIGLMVFNTSGISSALTADYLKLVLVRADTDYSGTGGSGLADGNVIHYGSHSDTAADPYKYSTGVGASENLTLNYTASSHTLAVSNGGTLLHTFGIAGTGGDTNQSWGMSGSDGFVIGLYAQATTNSDATLSGFTLPAGIAYADNFASGGLVAAVPEPSTYALLFSLTVIGAAIWRKRR